jgi:hypothetical protein
MDTQMIGKRLWTSPLGAAVTWRLLRPVVRLAFPLIRFPTIEGTV